MLHFFTSRFRSARQGGFTLIELLVVIAIIGVLASIVLASLNTARRKSRDARRVADIKQLQLALELYFDANSSAYPDATPALAGATACGSQACIPAIPVDPLGGAYRYCHSTATSYHLGASLEESTNPALNSDSDAPADATCIGGGGGNNAGAPVTGADGADCGGTAGRYCYDVTP